MTEEAAFHEIDGERLFAVVHRPAADAGRGVVLCAPLGEEQLWAHRVFVSWARDLAAQGFTVVRFDYRGEGDSDREFEQSDLETRVADTAHALAILRGAAPGLQDTTVVGLRLGASIAALAATSQEGVDRLVLCDPVADGAAYMQAVLRINLAAQMALHRKVVAGRDELVAAMEQGTTVNIEGYELAAPFYRQVTAFRLAETLPQFAGASLLVQIAAEGAPPRRDLAALEAACPRVRVASVVEEPFWKEIKTFYQRAERLFDVTRQWLEEPVPCG